MIHLIKEILKALVDKIDVILGASLTLAGFLITALTIIITIMPNYAENSLKQEFFNDFKIAIRFSLICALFAFLCLVLKRQESVSYILAFIDGVLFLITLWTTYKSVKSLFFIAENK